MSINFDRLPKEKPEGMGEFTLPAEGFHKATIHKTEMKVSKAGNDYLSLQLKLSNGSIIFDIIMDSDKPALMYKLSRLIQACHLPLTGELTLEDLGKVILNKEIVVDVVHNESEYNGKTTTRAEVEMFANDIYYPIEEYSTLIGEADSDEQPTTGTY